MYLGASRLKARAARFIKQKNPLVKATIVPEFWGDKVTFSNAATLQETVSP
jgi:hypothetical protein